MLDEVLDSPIDWRDKSFPHAEGATVGTAAQQGWDVLGGDFSFPLLVLREAALEHNVRRMAEYCAASQVLLAPHGKTHLSPQLWERQRAAGAMAVTVANVSQARVFERSGARDFIIANQVVDRPDLEWVQSRRSEGVRILLVVDSLPIVGLLARELAMIDGPAPEVLVELGYPAGRAGARTPAEATAVATEALELGMRVRGIEGFEGVMPAPTDAARRAAVGAYLVGARDLLESWIVHELVEDPIATFGGSSFFDQVVEVFGPLADRGVSVILRSGCYLTHDHGLYASRSPFEGSDDLRPAIELWARVLARPEPGLAIVGFGRRDVGSDAGLPIPLHRRIGTGAVEPLAGTVRWLNDQHAGLQLEPGAALEVGDLVSFGVSHPCTTLQCWGLIPVLDEHDHLVGAVRTYF